MVIEPVEYAQAHYHNLACQMTKNIKNPVAIAVFRMHDNESSDIVFRDRSREVEAMLKGLYTEFGHDFLGTNDAIYSETFTGKELAEKFFFQIEGAQFSYVYKVMVI